MRTILAIDPGTHESGYAIVCEYNQKLTPIIGGVMSNEEIKTLLHGKHYDLLAIEGMEPRRSSTKFPVLIGSETYDTCIWIGRFIENSQSEWIIIKRGEVLRHVAKHGAKDAEVRAAMIKKFGPTGTKKNPGGTYGFSSHAWSALAVAVTAFKL